MSIVIPCYNEKDTIEKVVEAKASLIKSIELEEDRFGIDPEFIAKLAQRGGRVYDVGISYSGQTYKEGKED